MYWNNVDDAYDMIEDLDKICQSQKPKSKLAQVLM